MCKVKQPVIVTRESLRAMLATADTDQQVKIVGRALVVLLKRQTESERLSHSTNQDNGVGFAGCDAKIGTYSAEGYIKYGHLLPFQMEAWLRERNGFPRICKYAKQLNEAAVEKATRLANKNTNDQVQLTLGV